MPLVIDNTRALALPVPADRVRRRHRRALGDQVPRRPRHDDGRRDRRVGQVPLGQRQVSRDDRALARLPRRDLPRDLRRLRLHDEGAHGDDAHLRPDAVADERVAAAAGHRDAARAHGAALRERARGGASSCRSIRGWRGSTTRACRTTSTTRWRRSTCRKGALGPAQLRRQGRREGRRALHRGGAVHEPPRQHRRREDAGDPSGLDHAPAAGRSRAASRPA